MGKGAGHSGAAAEPQSHAARIHATASGPKRRRRRAGRAGDDNGSYNDHYNEAGAVGRRAYFCGRLRTAVKSQMPHLALLYETSTEEKVIAIKPKSGEAVSE
eukprot:gene7821-biopygen10978